MPHYFRHLFIFFTSEVCSLLDLYSILHGYVHPHSPPSFIFDITLELYYSSPLPHLPPLFFLFALFIFDLDLSAYCSTIIVDDPADAAIRDIATFIMPILCPDMPPAFSSSFFLFCLFISHDRSSLSHTDSIQSFPLILLTIFHHYRGLPADISSPADCLAHSRHLLLILPVLTSCFARSC